MRTLNQGMDEWSDQLTVQGKTAMQVQPVCYSRSTWML